MHLVEQRRQFSIDVQGIERLLSHVSRLLNISIDIKNPEGETMMCGPDNSHGMCRRMKENVPGKCGAKRLSLIRQIDMSGETMLHTTCDGIDIMLIPLQCNKELVGILCACWSADDGNMGQRAGAFLEEIAHRLSYEIQNQFESDNLTRELSKRYEELNLIYNIGKDLGKIDTAGQAIKFIVEQLQKAIEPDAVLVSIPSNDILEIKYSSPTVLPFDIADNSIITTINEILLKRLASSEACPEHIVLDGTCDDSLPAELCNVYLETVATRIKAKHSADSILCIINFHTARTFETGDIRLLASLAEQISLFISNTDLYENLKDFLISVIKSLVYSIEAKDSYTRGHSERVSILAQMIAEAMELSPREKEELHWAAILHDIGKIGVSDTILRKEGILTQDEMSYMKEHSEKGYTILKPIEQLNESLSAIRHHHERYDGTGYPSGLKGKEIPLYARIIAIADTYDAITSKRAYRGKISYEDAIAEIVSVKGQQLDPELVEIFIKICEPTSSIFTV